MTPSAQTVYLTTLAATAELAAAAVELLPDGTLLVLSGPLGSGKTTFTKALVAALDPDMRVSSPTYSLVHEYPTAAGLVVHMDAYRLGDAALLEQLGLDEYLERARLVIVEWGGELAERQGAAWLEFGFDEDSRWARWRKLP
ncbi:MAG: tRNA (adenosine(37)-N6)-threonylcarbamoyltransferase complex ATPase subunit type 1 TsaE [Trueperaceae bacterium]|nr:tRNA (adenosine(37)-N6)-threonylcarbamoyltransferase complex ATPase subunit type 1 TsaE [Trueperaceae bacterium]